MRKNCASNIMYDFTDIGDFNRKLMRDDTVTGPQCNMVEKRKRTLEGVANRYFVSCNVI